jgi:hypothetical protein
MQSYGVYTPTVSAYSGVATPDALKAGATAGEKGTYQGALADYAAQQAAFRGYETDYKNRIANTNLYTSPDTASTFLSTPNYSGIRGMRANLSDTTSEDTTDYTNPNFSSMINDAYRSLGRVGIGTDTSNIDQPGYNYWLGQLQAGANGGIAPRDFKNQFKIATNDYIRQKPDDDYTKYIQGYLGILPAATLPVLPTTGGGTTSGTDVDQRAGEGPGANPGSAYDGGGMGLGPTGNEQVGLDANQAANNQNASASATAEIADQESAQDAAEVAANSSYMARGGPVSSPTSMEEALLRDRSRHEFSDPRFEEIYGKYFYDAGGTFIPGPRSALQKVLKYEGLLPRFFGRGPDIVSPGDTPPPSLPPSFIPDPLSVLKRALKYEGLLPGFFGRGPNIASPSGSSTAERGGSLGSFGDVPSSVGNPDDLMSLVYNPGNADDRRRAAGRPQLPISVVPPWIVGFPDNNPGNPPQIDPPSPVPVLPPVTAPTPPPESGIRGGGATQEPEPFLSTVTAPPAAPVTASPTYEEQRDALYRRYFGPQSASPEMLAARQTAREAQANFVKMLNDQSSGETGPSEAEKYFRLASAMLAPTTTRKGAFFEAAGRAGQQMKEVEESTTKSKNVAQAAKQQRMLKANEITWQVAKEELASIRAQEEGNRKDTLAFRLEELRDRRDQNNPKTDIHNQLIGRGFVRGTPKYQEEYDRLTALAEEAAAIKLAQAKQNYNSLTSIEQKALLGSEQGLVDFEASMKKLREALDINDQTLATGNFADLSQDALKTKLGSNDPLVVNTARQAIMLSLVGLGKLKLTFPGAISDKETAIMTKLQGINSATLDGRKRIIADALLDLEELKIEMIKHISDIRARKYRTYDPAGAAP